VLFAAMGLIAAKAVLVLFTEGNAETAEPAVVLETLAGPDGAGMFRVANGQVALGGCACGTLLSRGRRLEVWSVASGESEDPVGRVEELRRLEDHLDNVLVTVPSCTARWLMGQIEDVHSCGWG